MWGVCGVLRTYYTSMFLFHPEGQPRHLEKSLAEIPFGPDILLVPGIDFVVPPSPRHLLVPHQQQQQQHPPKNLSVGTLLIAAEDVYTVHCRQPACLDVWWTVVVVVVVVSSPKCVRRSQNVPISRYSASSEGVYELQYIQPSSKGVPKVTQQQ